MNFDLANFDLALDATGLACPLPIVKAKKALAGLATGQVLKVASSDTGSVDDMPEFAAAGGHELLASTQEGETFVFYIRKG